MSIVLCINNIILTEKIVYQTMKLIIKSEVPFTTNNYTINGEFSTRTKNL